MITLDLDKKPMLLDEVLRIASSGAVMLRAHDGQEYVLEPADDFEREVAQLSQSERFMEFLHQRAQESGSKSLEAFKKQL